MTKENVIEKINEHIAKHNNQIRWFVKNKDYIIWINEYYINTALKDSPIIEKIWVLLHNDKIEYCECCGVKSKFGNFHSGYRSKRCKKCGSYEALKNNTMLRKNNSEEIIVKKECKHCKKEFSYKTRSKNNTIKRFFCSKSCATKFNQLHMSEEVRNKKIEKTKKTNLIKYGDEWVVNSKYTKILTKNKLGVSYAFQDKAILLKTKETLIKNYGCDSPMKDDRILKKMISTKLEKYGDLLNPMYRYKIFIFPAGRLEKIQGNEAKALNILLKQFDENDIFVGRKNIENQIGKILYKDSNNKMHVYYPDIYIKSINKIIEVKSQFTYNLRKNINELKKQAVLEKNILFDFMIID